ncbi:MAG: transcriptional repressor [Micromonosporaceae bacterium]|nr:transcriptional repressor [Micromonosporaceae bacterium]
MTSSSGHADASGLADLLRSRGLRLTAPRQLVLEAVRSLGHATADQVHATVAEQAAGVNITTVYRTLELLEELGLVTHVHLSHGAPTYHPAGRDQHVHLVCHSCGRIEELPMSVLAELARQLAQQQDFRLDIAHAALFGTCAACTACAAGKTSAR